MANIDKIIDKEASQRVMSAKSTLKSFVKTIDIKLNQYFTQELSKTYGFSSREKELSYIVWSHLMEHNLRSAKRLRASFVYFSYFLFKKSKNLLNFSDKDLIFDACLSVELIHTALLIHDDIMDEDLTRRGEPTSHIFFQNYHKKNNYLGDSHHFGESMAINSGDILLTSGYERLLKSKFSPRLKEAALSRLMRGIINTGFGQVYDVIQEANGKASEKDILNLHRAKTAIYTYENPLHIGAILSGATNDDLKLLSEYATPAGIAFQLQDDILGLFGDSEKTGKSNNSDIREGKITLLISKARELGSKSQIKTLNKLLGNKKITQKQADIVRKIVRETGSLDYSYKKSVYFAKKALKTIGTMREREWNTEAVDYLDGIAMYMIERDV